MRKSRWEDFGVKKAKRSHSPEVGKGEARKKVKPGVEDAPGKKVDEGFPHGDSRTRNLSKQSDTEKRIDEKIVADVMFQMTMREIDERIVADATIQREGVVRKNAQA